MCAAVLCVKKVVTKITTEMYNLYRFRMHCFRVLSSTSSDRSYLLIAKVPSINFRFQISSFSFCRSYNSACAPYPWACKSGFRSGSGKEKLNIVFAQRRWYANTEQEKGASSERKSLVHARENPYAHLTVGQKVKEVGKDVSYLAVIAFGFAVTGLIFYVIGSELFSSDSPSGVYGDALKKCQNSIEVTAALGEPIKAYGETTRRGRRRHVRHTEFEADGVSRMRMQFYIEGPNRSKATVHAEVQKDASGKFEYYYLVVETEGYPHRTFVLEDNRQKNQLQMVNV